MFMMTVLAAVICGVTCQPQRRVLERRRHGVVGDGLHRDLHALRDLRGLVVLRRQARRREDAPLAAVLERGQRDVEVERAVDRSERQADRRRGRRDRQVDGRVAGPAGCRRADRSGPAVPPDAAADRSVVRERQAGGVADRRVGAAVEAPLDAERAGEVARRLDDARFDFDLRLRLVERARSAPAPSPADRAGPG